MRHWSRLATRNWRVKRVRTAGAILAIALGTGAVVWVTCCYDSVRQAMLSWAGGYVGGSHINIQSPLGKYDTLPQRIVRKVERVAGVKHVAPVLIQQLPATPVRTGTPAPPGGWAPTLRGNEAIDFHGIDLERERFVRDWDAQLAQGRMLSPEDEMACVLEMSIAEEEGLRVGDRLLVWRQAEYIDDDPVMLDIVGLINRERIARFQKGVALVRLPVLQQITHKQVLVNAVDVVLNDPNPMSLQSVARDIHARIRADAPGVHLRSAAARLQRIQLAQEQQRVVLVLLSCMALLTALFIILSTLSMGMLERIAQLGLLRCVGMTRMQLAGLVLAEVLPLGVVGVLLGIPIGMGFTLATVRLVPEYVGTFVVSRSGVALAAGAGLLTTLIAAALPAFAAMRVSPLEATRPRARRIPRAALLVTLAGTAALLALQHYVMASRVQRDLLFVQWSAVAIVVLYVAYAGAAPLLVWVASRLTVPIMAAILRMRSRLLQDQVGHAVFRSAGICCGLMVGLSLIVGLIVFNASFRSGWQFPKQFPEAYIWSHAQITGDTRAAIEQVPGVKNFMLANAIDPVIEERQPILDRLMRSVAWFLGVEPDSFFELVQLEFVEGDRDTAIELLKQGGHVLIATDFARTRNKGVKEVRDEDGRVIISNKVNILFNNAWRQFTVAGVIDSPALDIAASYFQVQEEAMVAAVGSVIGTNADLEHIWDVHGVKLVLLNFDLPPEPPPAGWPPPRGTPEARWLGHVYYNEAIPVERRWQNYRETQVLQSICRRVGANGIYGTARELKDEIDAQFTRVTYLLSAVPTLALVVAAIGVANLMTANVASRTKQLATLRAVGATRGLVLRMVIGEALVLGALGSVLGLALGLHLAQDVRVMTARMWGYQLPFEVPWNMVGLAILLTVGLCVLAGIAPARHASRTNVIEALHVA